MICKGCAYKGEAKDFLQGGIYVCPKCKSMNIKIEKAATAGPATPYVSPRTGNTTPKEKPERANKPLSEFNPRNPPETAPSGKASNGYGEIVIRVWMTGPKEDPTSGAEAAIMGPSEMPFPFWMIGCEHLMTMTAQKSRAGFEKALELLVEGAMTNRGKLVKK
jgi:hypothetical protein